MPFGVDPESYQYQRASFLTQARGAAVGGAGAVRGVAIAAEVRHAVRTRMRMEVVDAPQHLDDEDAQAERRPRRWSPRVACVAPGRGRTRTG